MALRCFGFLLLASIVGTAGCSHSRGSSYQTLPNGTRIHVVSETTNATQDAVRDGAVVLVKKGNCYGAFIPRGQHVRPEGLAFGWYYRTDGKGVFTAMASTAVRSGRGSGIVVKGEVGQFIRFGPFSVPWSAHGDGEGYLYYQHYEGEKVAPGDQMLCVTNETDIAKIDATDPKWVYKGAPTDPGMRVTTGIRGR
jgi:hypothetical protein